MLNIAEIVRRTGIDRDALNKYLKLPENRRLFGGEETHPLYPDASLRLFFILKQMRDAGTVTPQKLALMMQIRDRGFEAALPQEDEYADSAQLVRSEQHTNPLVPYAKEETELLILADIRNILASLRQQQEETTAPLPDTALSRLQAAEVLNVHPSTVSRLVVPLSRGRYSAVMVQRVLAEQRAIAEAKQEARAQQPPQIRRRPVPAISPPDSTTE